jgi:PAS domain S-box-containing protein/diguanylate cyclase (GGDEF)-like protein/putative nucleotidyltransferase with HDIG domain
MCTRIVPFAGGVTMTSMLPVGSPEVDGRGALTDAFRLAAILESSPDAIIAWSLDGELTDWNQGAERLFGYSRDEALGMPVSAIWKPDVRATLEHAVSRLSQVQDVARLETEHIRKDGAPVDVSVTISAVRDAGRQVIGISSIVRDISEQRRADRHLAEERTRWVAAFRSAPIGMALIHLDGSWMAVNRALERLLQRDRDALDATDLRSLTHPEDLDSDADEMRRVLDGEIEGYEIEKRYRLPDGGFVWAQLSLALVRDLVDDPLYFVFQLQDITARKEAEAQLARYADQLGELARRDPVTGLHNYREFHSLLDVELDRGRRYDSQWSVVLFDLDGFSQLNEVDRETGDRALFQTGHAIADACRTSDRAARIGGDEFALILPHTGKTEARAAATRITAAVARTGAASLSFGAATWPDDGDTVQLLLLRADMSLRAAKPGPQEPVITPQMIAQRLDCPTDAVRQIVGVVQQFLGMEMAYLAEMNDDTQTFAVLSGDGDSFGIQEGSALEADGTYCRRMLAGDVGHAVPAVADEAELAGLPITATAGIGSYVGVPVALANGHLYGSLCAISHDATPGLNDAQVQVMNSLAHLIADHIEHDAHNATQRRSSAELTGMNALLAALIARDQYTAEHSQTVVTLASAVARRLGLEDQQVREVEQVALLHDIGKVGIPDAILQKHGALDEREWELMRQHPAVGARMLAGTRTLAHLAPAVNAEHERFDGGGYPDGLRGQAIPLASRITFACDAYHAMTSDRPYRAALDPQAARGELRAGSGTQFDPRVVAALLHELDRGHAAPDASRPAGQAPERQDVLNVQIPRQTPVWETKAPVGSPQALGKTRAVCRRCGSHTVVFVTRAAIGGNCTNCGGYDLELLKDTPGAAVPGDTD